jgi:hypothetical protein
MLLDPAIVPAATTRRAKYQCVRTQLGVHLDGGLSGRVTLPRLRDGSAWRA